MKIEIADDLYDKLTHKAAEAGYVDVTAYVSAVADGSVHEPRGPLAEADLQASVDRLKQADAAIDAGKGIDADEAMRRIAAKHAFSVEE